MFTFEKLSEGYQHLLAKHGAPPTQKALVSYLGISTTTYYAKLKEFKEAGKVMPWDAPAPAIAMEKQSLGAFEKPAKSLIAVMQTEKNIDWVRVYKDGKVELHTQNVIEIML
jgi:hypothetical protein